MKDLEEALEKNDIDDIKKYKEKLQDKAMALSAKVYEEAAKSAQAESNNEDSDEDKSSKKKDDDVKEADVEED